MRSPRITVSLEPEQAETLRRLSAARGVSQAVLIRELLEAVQPALERVAGLLETVQKAQAEVPEALRDLLDEDERDWDVDGFDVDMWRDIAQGVRAGGTLAEPGVNPRPVTRGLGWPFGDPGHPTDSGRLVDGR